MPSMLELNRTNWHLQQIRHRFDLKYVIFWRFPQVWRIDEGTHRHGPMAQYIGRPLRLTQSPTSRSGVFYEKVSMHRMWLDLRRSRRLATRRHQSRYQMGRYPRRLDLPWLRCIKSWFWNDRSLIQTDRLARLPLCSLPLHSGWLSDPYQPDCFGADNFV